MTGRANVKGWRVGYESTLERDLLILFDADPSITRVTEQPVRIPYRSRKGRASTYVPDFRADARVGPGLLAEVKYRAELRARWADLRPRFEAAVAYARANGLRFRLFDERAIRTPLLRNLTFLKRYPAAFLADDAAEEHLVATLERLGAATAATLVQAAYQADDNRLRAVPVLWGLVATRRIAADLTVPLTMASTLRVAPGGGTQWPGPHSYEHPLAEALYRRHGLVPPARGASPAEGPVSGANDHAA